MFFKKPPELQFVNRSTGNDIHNLIIDNSKYNGSKASTLIAYIYQNLVMSKIQDMYRIIETNLVLGIRL